MNSLQHTRLLAALSTRLASTEVKLNAQILEHASSSTSTEIRPFSRLPRPSKWQFIRSFMPGGEYQNSSMMEFGNDMRKRYGDIFIMPGMFGRPDTVVIFNTKDIETVFRSEGVWPHREGFGAMDYFRSHVRNDVYGYSKGLVSTQAEEWGKLRSAVNPVFMQPKGLRMYYEPLSNINNEFIERIKEIRDPKTLEVPADFEEEMSRLIFESLALVAFDREMGLIRKRRDNPDALTLFRMTREVFRLIFQLDMQPSMWKWVSTPTFRRMMRVLDDSLNTAQRMLEETNQELAERRKRGEQVNANSMMERMLAIDPKIALIMGLDILFAGVDATATLLSALLLCLAKHPEKQQKLREELFRVMPTKDALLNEESMKDMPYLRAVIKEALRYYPNSLGTLRSCPSDITLSGYEIPKGTSVLVGANALLKDESYYPRANEFLPERWLRDPITNKKTPMNPFTFLPFGFGPRQCIGKRVVDLEMETAVAKLIRNFHVEFNHDASKPYKSFFVMEPAIPFQFKFTDVEQ